MGAHANQGGKSFRLEKVVRNAVFKGDHEDIQKIVDQLCHDYAYAVHQPHARNGGLIGLAAASIALGSVSEIGYTGNISLADTETGYFRRVLLHISRKSYRRC